MDSPPVKKRKLTILFEKNMFRTIKKISYPIGPSKLRVMEKAG